MALTNKRAPGGDKNSSEGEVPADDRSQPVRATLRSPLPAPLIAVGAAVLGIRWWLRRRSARRAGGHGFAGTAHG
jgi:hypothetical protein